MPSFLTREIIFKAIQRELPEDVYAQGSPSAFFSTADSDSVAQVIANAYSRLNIIYDNYFPQTSEERIVDWEIAVFGEAQDPSLSLSVRRSRILIQLQTLLTMSIPDIKSIILSVIGTDKLIDIRVWGCESGGWMLDFSPLDEGTFLTSMFLISGVFNPGLCNMTAAELGMTDQQLLDWKRDAYTYEVIIYNYTLTADERTRLDAKLNIYEPARSGHVITDNQVVGGPIDPRTLDGGGFGDILDTEDFGTFDRPPIGDDIIDEGGF